MSSYVWSFEPDSIEVGDAVIDTSELLPIICLPKLTKLAELCLFSNILSVIMKNYDQIMESNLTGGLILFHLGSIQTINQEYLKQLK